MSTRRHRMNRAIHLHYTTDMTLSEIGDEIGVSKGTVSNYLSSDIGEEVQEMVKKESQQVILVSLNELKAELRELHSMMEEVKVEKEEADVEVKVHRDEDGNIVYDEYVDDNGIKQMFKVPQGYEIQPDTKTRYFRRAEWREIREQIRDVLEQMRELTGVDTAEKIDINLEGSVDHTHSMDEQTMEQVEELNDQFKV